MSDHQIDGELAPPFSIYICDENMQALRKVQDCWNEEEVLAFRQRRDQRYIVYVRRKPIPLHKFKAGER